MFQMKPPDAGSGNSKSAAATAHAIPTRRRCGGSKLRFTNSISYHEPMVLDPAVGILIDACLALLFAGAGIHKLRDLKRFEEIFSAYGLMPVIARVSISWLVP